MKIGFIIICRNNSSRLPGKILMEIKGKAILKYILERLNFVVPASDIVIATSQEKSDDPIAVFCANKGYQCFRGDLENASKRFLDCTEKFGFDFAARINGDNLFVDIDSLQKMIEITKTDNYDFISNVKNRTFPKGMSIEIVKADYYKSCYKMFSNPGHFEHITLWLYENDADKNHYYHYNTVCPEAAGIQLAIDTPEDFAVAEKIFSNFTLDHTFYGLKDVFEIISRINEK